MGTKAQGRIYAGLLIASLLAVLFSMAAGQYAIPFTDVLQAPLSALGLSEGSLSEEQQVVLQEIRAPRTLVAYLVGAALAVSGTTLQAIFSNALADPGILGISAGASFGAVLAIALGGALTSLTFFPLFSFGGALLAMAVTVALSMRHGRVPALTLLLAGVVVSMFLAACTAAVLTVIDAQKLQQYLFWTIGGLDYRRWEHVYLAAPPILFCSAVLFLLARHLDILALGEAEGRVLGMAVTRMRIAFLLLAALATSTAVCVSGNIGFVGLVVPHMLRLLGGSSARFLLPASFLAGGAFLVLCDALGRVLVPGIEVRVGIMTAFLGAPYFLFLLRRALRMET